MGRFLFYLVILVIGAALAYALASVIGGLGVTELADVGEEETFRSLAERSRGFVCNEGPVVLGLPIKDLAVGFVTTLFGLVMRGMFGRRS